MGVGQNDFFGTTGCMSVMPSLLDRPKRRARHIRFFGSFGFDTMVGKVTVLFSMRRDDAERL